jgi:MerR family transcriptional regulator, thiopeptide resistance regulator
VNEEKRYSVKELADIAGVSGRTLRFYDREGLLKPRRAANGYRYYDEAALLRLQQILFYRELDFSLDEIRSTLDKPGFKEIEALEQHRESLKSRATRIDRLIKTIDETILHLKGERKMSDKKLFEVFSEDKQKKYEQQIKDKFGEKAFDGVKDWNKYSKEEKKKILDEQEVIYHDLAANIDKLPESPEVQRIVARWHRHLRFFYEPSPERMAGLAQMYTQHPDFQTNFRKIHPRLPGFLHDAIIYYVKGLGLKNIPDCNIEWPRVSDPLTKLKA